ncbi:MAG: flavin reductase family protein [Candidatus Bathyarchaeia archaeon]
MNVQEVLEKILNGVAIVTSKMDNKINGLSVAWITQVSFQPPLVAVSIGKTKYTHEMIKNSKVFAVSILYEGQVDVAKHFGLRSGKEIDKFLNIPYETKITGAPILKDCLAYIDCKLEASFDIGDHTIFVGKILDAGIKQNKKPLIYNPKDYW